MPLMQATPENLIERLDRVLPQTQCGQCGFDGCRPYAEAMARGEAGVERCPPGGDAGARTLARILGVPALPFDRSRGETTAADDAGRPGRECGAQGPDGGWDDCSPAER